MTVCVCSSALHMHFCLHLSPQLFFSLEDGGSRVLQSISAYTYMSILSEVLLWLPLSSQSDVRILPQSKLQPHPYSLLCIIL